jgi:Tax1-binding protein 1
MPAFNEDIVIVESKDYAQVIFDDVKECYTENQPLECSFTISELLKPDAADWIGIYRVGFTSCKDDYVCYLQVNPSEILENKGKVVFEG